MWKLKIAGSRVKETSLLVPVCLLLFVTILVVRCETGQEVEEGRTDAFSKKLYQTLSQETASGELQNLIFSPLSLEIVLAVAGLGARGNTQTQISRAIGVPLEVSTLHDRYSPVLFGIKEDEGRVLRIASQIFVEKRFPLRDEFVNASVEGFACGVEALDFATHPDSAAHSINAWVEEKTEGLIKNLIDPSAISTSTKVVLTNAVYFKGKWATQFDQSLTTRKKFQLAGGNKVNVDMMQGEMWSRYGHPKELNAKVLELPYVGEDLSMVILLPDKTSTIAELESKISEDTFNLNEIITNHTRKVEVFVSLPKFRLELETNLEGPLMKLGLTDMFTNHANFSGMSNAPNGLKISKVLQKAFIEVSEEGTEAAAATDMEIIPLMGRVRPNFKANRPFVFVIFHKASRTKIFVGRLADPIHFT